jgi:hypothetical protein
VASDKGVALSGIAAVPMIIEYQYLKMSTGFVATVPVIISIRIFSLSIHHCILASLLEALFIC